MEKNTVITESKHTKGKWAVRDYEIIGPYGSNKSICEMTGNFTDREEKKANAAYIVKCVNAHSDLVKALQGALHSIELMNEALVLVGCTPQNAIVVLIKTALQKVNE